MKKDGRRHDANTFKEIRIAYVYNSRTLCADPDFGKSCRVGERTVFNRCSQSNKRNTSVNTNNDNRE